MMIRGSTVTVEEVYTEGERGCEWEKCDGTWQAYKRHLHHKIPACNPAKRAWARYYRNRRKRR